MKQSSPAKTSRRNVKTGSASLRRRLQISGGPELATGKSPEPADKNVCATQLELGATLIAVVGISPAILTETIWALAKPGNATSSVLPDEVIAITTTQGRDKITEQLLTPSADFGGQTVWQALRLALLGSGAVTDSRLTMRIAVIERSDPKTGLTEPLTDIRDAEQNLVAAEFILRQVRDQTSSKDRRLIASLAGGRKTMGALLHAAFSHLGRPQDRLTHILVEEPFDGGVKPLFFFPEQPTQTLTARDGKTYQARDARLQLADVPFAPLRLRFPDIADIPTRFRDLVETYCEVFKRDANEPAVVQLLDHPPRLVVNGLTTELESERQLLVWQFLLEANREEWVQKDQAEALEIFKAWQGHALELNRVRPALRKTVEQLHEKHKAKPGPTWVGQATSDDIKRPLSFARRKLEKDGSRWQPPKRDLRLPPFRWVRSS
jgi:CRISPR-associated protein (TIGR02584 family)